MLGRADQESNAGMRPPPEKVLSKPVKGKKVRRRTVSQLEVADPFGQGKKKDNNVTTFKVASVVLVPCGVEFAVCH